MSGTKRPFFRVIEEPPQDAVPEALPTPIHEPIPPIQVEPEETQAAPGEWADGPAPSVEDPTPVPEETLTPVAEPMEPDQTIDAVPEATVPDRSSMDGLPLEDVMEPPVVLEEHSQAPAPVRSLAIPEALPVDPAETDREMESGYLPVPSVDPADEMPAPASAPKKRGKGFFGRRSPEPAAMSDEEDPLGPESVSVMLRNRREEIGYSVEEIAGMLRIRLPYLQAIENADWGNLPGTPYAIGFVKSYASFLNLSVDPIVERFKQEIDGSDNHTKLVFPTPEPEARVPSLAIFGIAVLLGALGYGGWYLSTRPPTGLIDSLPLLPDRFTEFLQGTSEPDEGGLLATPGSDGGNALVGREQVEIVDAAQATTSEESAAEPDPSEEETAAGVDTATGDEADQDGAAASDSLEADDLDAQPGTDDTSDDTTPSPDDGGSVDEAVAAPTTTRDGPPPEIALVGTGMSWFQVRDAAGGLILTRVLQDGDRFDLPWQDGMVLDTGNAGGMIIEVDGDAMPALGEPGEVVRGVVLDLETLRAGTAAGN